MRLKSILIPVLAFALAALVAWLAAGTLVRVVEERSVIAVREALIDGGHDWASVLGDGLQIVIEGEAPSEGGRLRAIAAAGTVVDANRVIDNMRVRESASVQAPEFAIEILRNDSGVSLVGLIPAATDREALTERIADAAAGQEVADLLQTASYPAPEGWDDALDYAMTALSRLPRSKISVTAGAVEVTAIASSREEQQRLVADLGRIAPGGLALTLEVTAPRPVVTPFTLRFVDGKRSKTEQLLPDADQTIEIKWSTPRGPGAPPPPESPKPTYDFVR